MSPPSPATSGFGWAEAEDRGIAPLGHAAAIDLASESMRSVKYQPQAVALRYLFKDLYLSRGAENVDGQDRGCPLSDSAFHFFRVNIEIAGIGVGQDRPQPVPQQTVASGEKSEARQNHLARQLHTTLNQHQP